MMTTLVPMTFAMTMLHASMISLTAMITILVPMISATRSLMGFAGILPLTAMMAIPAPMTFVLQMTEMVTWMATASTFRKIAATATPAQGISAITPVIAGMFSIAPLIPIYAAAITTPARLISAHPQATASIARIAMTATLAPPTFV